MEIYLPRTLFFQIKGKKKSILNWSNWKGAMNSPFYRNRDKCGKLGPNPSAKNGPVHFLLGAMIPCSTPFSTSGGKSCLNILYKLAFMFQVLLENHLQGARLREVVELLSLLK